MQSHFNGLRTCVAVIVGRRAVMSTGDHRTDQDMTPEDSIPLGIFSFVEAHIRNLAVCFAICYSWGQLPYVGFCALPSGCVSPSKRKINQCPMILLSKMHECPILNLFLTSFAGPRRPPYFEEVLNPSETFLCYFNKHLDTLILLIYILQL